MFSGATPIRPAYDEGGNVLRRIKLVLAALVIMLAAFAAFAAPAMAANGYNDPYGNGYNDPYGYGNGYNDPTSYLYNAILYDIYSSLGNSYGYN